MQPSICCSSNTGCSAPSASYSTALLKTLIPPPIYALATAGLMWLVDRQFPALRWIVVPWNRFGFLPIAIGFGLDISAVWSFIRERTTISPMHPSHTNRLVDFGVYRISRNPMYLGLVMSLSGWAWLLGSPVCLTLVWVFARVLEVLQIAPEESALRDKFGDAYVEYTRRVNRWLGRPRSATHMRHD